MATSITYISIHCLTSIIHLHFFNSIYKIAVLFFNVFSFHNYSISSISNSKSQASRSDMLSLSHSMALA